MDKVFFSSDLNSLFNTLRDRFKESTVVYHSMYGVPRLEAVHVIEWEEYRKVYQSLITREIVLIGLNRMITPTNRCDFVHEYLTTLTPNIPKIVIDTSPFIGEPWRLFFHFLFANINKFGFSYSYPIEQEWLRWFLRDTPDCKFSPSNLGLFTGGFKSTLSCLNTCYTFYALPDKEEDWYNEMRGHVFNKYTSPKMWIKMILSETNRRYGVDLDFDSFRMGGVFEVPDLKIYRFVVEENQRRQGIYNHFVK